MVTTDRPKRKISLYFPAEISAQLDRECLRLERPLYWVLERAWTIARAAIVALPARPPEEPGRPRRRAAATRPRASSDERA